jgi:hypothetical protein
MLVLGIPNYYKKNMVLKLKVEISIAMPKNRYKFSQEEI